MYKLNQIKLNIYHSDEDFKKKIAKTAGVSVADIDWSTLIILHKSIDARDKNNILFVYNIAFDFVGASSTSPQIKRLKNKLEKYEPVKFNPYKLCEKNVGKDKINYVGASTASPKVLATNGIRPIVVGFGPAGIFASYIFALNGLKPITIERGKSLDDRIKDVDKFFKTMELDEESNVCFGEGGAGAFSDGKLNTNNKDKTGIYHFILETFVKFGADERILYENMPHIGTDKLVGVIKNMRNEIIKLGGEIHYNTKLKFENGLASFAPTIIKDTPIVLAIGNSSRDTFRELIENGFDLKAKPFAIGYRIAHGQLLINEAQYGGARKTRPYMGSTSIRPYEDKLGPATYKLTYDVGNGHSVYSFCMCPGGFVIPAATDKEQIVVNGMSPANRGTAWSNSGMVVETRPEDVEGDDVLRVMRFQEQLERMCWQQGNMKQTAPSQRMADFVNNRLSYDLPKSSYAPGLISSPSHFWLPPMIGHRLQEGFKTFGRQAHGFLTNEAVLIAVETRTSSPVRILRDAATLQHVRLRGLFPCGEGAGYAGGIVSAGVDGERCAEMCAEYLSCE